MKDEGETETRAEEGTGVYCSTVAGRHCGGVDSDADTFNRMITLYADSDRCMLM